VLTGSISLEDLTQNTSWIIRAVDNLQNDLLLYHHVVLNALRRDFTATYNSMTSPVYLKTKTYAILVYPPYILSYLLKCFFSPIDTPNAPSHAHTHNGNLRPKKSQPRTTTPKGTQKTSNILIHKPRTPNPIEYHRQHNLLSRHPNNPPPPIPTHKPYILPVIDH